MKTRNPAAFRREHAMSDARTARREFAAALDAGVILTHLRPVAHYVREARRHNREAYRDARITRAWRGDRLALEMPRLMYAYR